MRTVKVAIIPHLVRRTWQSYRAKPLTEREIEDVRAVLRDSEWNLWSQFKVPDQRHSYIVLERFRRFCSEASIDAMRAALLHDIGKIAVDLSTTQRVIATFLGPRTQRFRTYHDHEKIGLDLLTDVSSDQTIQLLRAMFYFGDKELLQKNDASLVPDHAVVQALCQADHV